MNWSPPERPLGTRLTKWSWAATHPQRDESGRLQHASEPGQGRRLLVPSSPEQNGPECCASGTPHCCPLRLASPLEVRHGSYPSPLLRDRHSQRIGGCVSPVAGGPAGEDRGATLRHYDRRIAPASRVAVARGLH